MLGLGRLGLCFAVVLDQAGYDVVGMDVNPGTVEEVGPTQRDPSPLCNPATLSRSASEVGASTLRRCREIPAHSSALTPCGHLPIRDDANDSLQPPLLPRRRSTSPHTRRCLHTISPKSLTSPPTGPGQFASQQLHGAAPRRGAGGMHAHPRHYQHGRSGELELAATLALTAAAAKRRVLLNFVCAASSTNPSPPLALS